MKRALLCLCLSMAFFLSACGGSSNSDSSNKDNFLPAFPGAEGYGAKTKGGRGGKVIKVTNLDDSGPGSLREAVTDTEPRVVVFEVSGIINLESDLLILHPHITIAGQTSPGGIMVTGRKVLINTHEVIVQYMRFRVGSHQIANGADAGTLDSLNLWGDGWGGNPAYNIIIDHCSVGWGVDENMSITGGVTDTTVQWSIFAEGLSGYVGPGNGYNGGSYLHSDMSEHSKGIMVSGKPASDPFPNTVSLHHNYIAHNTDRSPLIYTPDNVNTTVDVVNNVVYNWKGGLSMQGEGTPKINWVYNYAKPGASSHSWSFEAIHHNGSNPPESLLYVQGNIGASRSSQNEANWNVGHYYYNELLDTAWRKLSPWNVPSVKATEMTYAYALIVLQKVGATVPARDSVDTRVVNDFAAGTGDIIDNVIYPDDFPVYANITPLADIDNDGMADSWEDAQGFDSTVDDSSLDHDGDGYTNIEEYLHYLSEA